MMTNLDSVRESLDIVKVVSRHVSLCKQGGGHVGLCPFHSEKTPSFMVNPARQFFNCFGCGASGDVFAFQQRIASQTFTEAVEALARENNIEVVHDWASPVDAVEQARKESLHLVNATVCRLYQGNSAHTTDGNTVNVDGRKFLAETAAHFGVAITPDRDLLREAQHELQLEAEHLHALGLLQKTKDNRVYDFFRNRVLFPIRNEHGKIAGFSGRKRASASAKSPKYINSPDSEVYKKASLLFGLSENRRHISDKKCALLVEGYFDALSVWESGHKNVVACCGTAVSDEQTRLVSKYAERVVLMFDGDEAGQKATEKAWEVLEKNGVFVQVCPMPKGLDPDAFIRESGAESFTNWLSRETVDAVLWLAKVEMSLANVDALALHKLAQRIAGYLERTKFSSLCPKWADEVSQITGLPSSTFFPNAQQVDDVPVSEQKTASVAVNKRESSLYGFIEAEGRYFIFRRGKREPVSNFVLHPLFLLQSQNDAARVFRAENIAGQKALVKFDGRSLVSLDAFCQTLERHGNFVFQGNQALLKKIKAKYFGALAPCVQIETLGWQPEHKIWAWANGIDANGIFFEVSSEDRVVTVGGKHFRLPEPDDKSEGKVFEYKKGQATLESWLAQITDVYRENDNGALLASYFLASMFRDVVYDRLRFFPLLFGFGPRGTGKSTLAWSLSHLYGNPLKQINLSSGTSVGFSRRASRYQNSVVWFDEYKNSLPPKVVEYLKGLYDGAGYLRGQYTNDNRTHSTEVNAGIFITGQDLPVADPALLTRVILLTFSKSSFSNDERQRFVALQRLEQTGGLSWIVSDAAQHWECFQENFSAGFQQCRPTLESMAKEKFSGEIEDRLLSNYAVLLTTNRIMKGALRLPTWFLQKAEAAVVRTLVAHLQMLNNSDDLAQFWDVFERMADLGFLIAGREWSLESPASVMLRHKDGKQETLLNEGGEKLLFIRLKAVHPSYMEYFRRLYNREGLSKAALEHYLKSSRAFIGNVDSWRFNDVVTSGLVFRYADLGINLKNARVG